MTHGGDHWEPDTCFGCRIKTIGVSAAAMPTRHPAVAKTAWLDKRWSQDHDAYRRLRKQGLQPGGIDNCAQMEQMARTRYEIEAGVCMPKDIPTKRLKASINAGHDISLANNVQPTVKVED